MDARVILREDARSLSSARIRATRGAFAALTTEEFADAYASPSWSNIAALMASGA